MLWKRIILMIFVLLVILIYGYSNDDSLSLNEWAERYGFEKDEVFPIVVGDYGFPYVEIKIINNYYNMLFDTGNMVGISVKSEIAEQLG